MSILKNAEIQAYAVGFKAGRRIALFAYRSINSTFKAAKLAKDKAQALDLDPYETDAYITAFADACVNERSRWNSLRKAIKLAKADYQTTINMVRADA